VVQDLVDDIVWDFGDGVLRDYGNGVLRGTGTVSCGVLGPIDLSSVLGDPSTTPELPST